LGNIYTSNRNNSVLKPVQKLNLFLDKIFPTLKALKTFDSQVMQGSIKSFLDLIITMGYKEEFTVDTEILNLIIKQNEV
jgi:hypothetical protein